MNNSLVKTEVRGPVSIQTLDRPEKRNALSTDLIARLSDSLAKANLDPDVRVVVITGSGSTFCAGMDLKETLSADGGLTEAKEKQIVASAQAIADLIDQVHKFSKPTIAALNGDAYGGGAGLAVACDFLIAVEGARIGYPEVKRGLVAAIVLHDLVRQVGDRRARALLLSGTPITATIACSWGLVERVVPFDQCLDVAVELGESLATGGPRALATTKRLLDESTTRPTSLRGAAAISAAIRVSDEAIEGVQAFLEKREPGWIPKKRLPQPGSQKPSKS